MAQNEVQKYNTVVDLYSGVRRPLETFYSVFDKLERMANFLNSADATTYPDVPAATLTDMSELRTAINAFLVSADTLAFLEETKGFIRI